MSSPTYKVFVSRRGNVFMTEIADMLANAVEATGREVDRDPTDLPVSEPGTINLVVAPHEYFLLMPDHSEDEIVRAAASSVCVGVEQPGTTWFEVGARYASYGPITIDINQRGVEELGRRGLEAYRLQLGYCPEWDAWGGSDRTPRETDVLFLGSLTQRRSEFLAQSAQVLSEWRCDLRVFEVTGPVLRGTKHFVTGKDKYDLLTGTRVLLNVHQGTRDYFEWARVIEAASNGCLVVSETSGGYAPFVPGAHFLQADRDSLVGRVDAILRNEELRTEITMNSYEFIRKHLALADSVDRLLTIVERRGRHTTDTSATFHALPNRLHHPGRRRYIPPEPAPLSAHAAGIAAALETEQHVRAAVKDLLLAEINQDRVIDGLLSSLAYGASDYVTITDTTAYDAADPDISVIITCHDYGQYIRQSIESVVASAGVAAEIIVVDDHSRDNSVEVLHRILHDLDGFPIRLVASSANRGPSPSRNLGAEHARAPFIFILDADNAVYPYGLQKLHTALQSSDVAFAYGFIEVYGDRGDLLSCLPWSIERLVQQNYIDTMALVRKQVWDEVGGFDGDADRMGGWDDYDFWLHLAAEGFHGMLVTDFVGRYRSHDASWSATVNLRTSDLAAFFRSKYPHLPWPIQENL